MTLGHTFGMRRMWVVGVAMAVSACSSSSSELVFVQGRSPDPGALVAKNSCTALADCCQAGQAGGLYCQDRSDCAAPFQFELDYGFCKGFSYVGFVATVIEECGCPGHDPDPPDAADAPVTDATDAG